jgi:hypothetical protein
MLRRRRREAPPLLLLMDTAWYPRPPLRRHRWSSRRQWDRPRRHGLLLLSGAGSALYLLVEPRPLWRRAAEVLPRRTRLSGAQGLGLAIVLGFTVSLAGFLVARLVLAGPRTFTGSYIEPVLVPE